MASTYNASAINFTGSTADKRNAARFLIRDTASPWIFDNGEIDAAIGQWANVYQAAAMLAELIIGGGRGVQSKKVGDTTITYYQRMIPSWRSHGLAHQAVFAGGTSVDAKDTLLDDSDFPTPAIKRGLHDHPDV